MKGRPLNKAEWKTLLKKNSPRLLDNKNIVSLLPLKLALMSGLREIEITLIPISSIVTATGELNEIFILPKEIAHNEKARPILLNEELKCDIEQYLKVLTEFGVNQMPHAAYLGFDPNSQLIVSDDFKPYKTQRRGLLTSRARIVPSELNKHLDALISNASLDTKGITRKSLIRTYVTQGLKAKWSLRDIAMLSGMTEANVSKIAVLDLEQYSPIADFFSNRDRKKKLKVKRLEKIRRWTFME